MDPRYIIVQAGGKGSRMQSLTRNKPKALVPVNNLPMIFHLFRKYPDRKFIVIGDYKYDVLAKYLKAFAEVDFQMVCASGHTGTCSGMREALSLVPEGEELLIIWCDLVLPAEFSFPAETGNYVGISKDFPCRWSYAEGRFYEERSAEHGVAGLFLMADKSPLAEVPESGELVRWMSEQGRVWQELPLYKTHEYGLYSEWDKLPKTRCRPFNQVEIQGDRVIKRPLDEQGRKLAEHEIAWYRKVQALRGSHGGIGIPAIYETDPLIIQRVNGRNIYEYNDIPQDQKKKILGQIIGNLKELHSLESVPADEKSFQDAYIDKTVRRLEKVRELVPFADQETVTVNGRVCRNIFFEWDKVKAEVMKYLPKTFPLLHGDCTFSNMMLEKDKYPIMIDPRGYFGTTAFYGDAAYDWVKVYYSLISNYDQFNLKRFSLDIGEKEVTLQIESNHWEDMEDEFFRLLEGEVTRKQMKLYLAIIWLSLTTYAWEDYDSICGAFYNGLMYLEEALRMSDEGTGDRYFDRTIRILTDSLDQLDMESFERLIEEAEQTLRAGHKIVASGLGKNVPVCEKFVGSMLSMGLDANFLHTNSAVHGDMGMVRAGDLVIILSKSGSTAESVYLTKLLQKRDCRLWALTFREDGEMVRLIGKEHSLIIPLEHEGDLWNIMPNNSTTLNLIVLQGLAMSLAERMGLELERDFKPNHPGGAIGSTLSGRA